MVIEIAGGEGQNFESRELLKRNKELDDAIVSVREDVADMQENIEELSDDLDDLSYGEYKGGINLVGNEVGKLYAVPTIKKDEKLSWYIESGNVNLSVYDNSKTLLNTYSLSGTGTLSYGMPNDVYYMSVNSNANITVVEGTTPPTAYWPYIMSNKQLTEHINNAIDEIKTDLSHRVVKLDDYVIGEQISIDPKDYDRVAIVIGAWLDHNSFACMPQLYDIPANETYFTVPLMYNVSKGELIRSGNVSLIYTIV